MGEVLDLAERFWRGEIPHRDLWRPTGKHEELAPGLVFFHTWANVTALRTGAGLVLVDTGNFATRDRTFAAVRAVDSAPLAAAVYTHGHVDHACGLPPFLAEAREKGRPEPAIVGHRNVAARFDRYRMTAPWNGLINSRQFSVAATWPTEYQYPGTVYDTTHALEIGGVTLELTHARGETDDHTWLWWPTRRILFTGDLFFWVAPNAGNPQKVQRYAAELGAGFARHGGSRRRAADSGPRGARGGRRARTPGALRHRPLAGDPGQRDVTRMNAGLALEDILAEVKPPAHLSERPYLQAVYDEPAYVIRNIWRLYGGWWDGQPAHLKPAREAEIGLEVAALAGGIDAVVARARALAAEGRLALASHLIDWVAAAAPDSWAVHDARADIYLARAQDSEALMTRGIFSEAARESAIKAGRPVTQPGAGQPR